VASSQELPNTDLVHSVTSITDPGEAKPPAKDVMDHLPQPELLKILPKGLSQVGPDAATSDVATPKAAQTAGYANAGDSVPVLALSSHTDPVLQMPAHWLQNWAQNVWKLSEQE
jgi:hypothetical protein